MQPLMPIKTFYFFFSREQTLISSHMGSAVVTLPGPHHHTEQVSNPGRWRGRSTKEAKGYSLQRQSLEHSPYWHTSVTLTPLNLTPVRVTAPM